MPVTGGEKFNVSNPGPLANSLSYLTTKLVRPNILDKHSDCCQPNDITITINILTSCCFKIYRSTVTTCFNFDVLIQFTMLWKLIIIYLQYHYL